MPTRPQSLASSAATSAWLREQILQYIPPPDALLWHGVATPQRTHMSCALRVLVYVVMCLPVVQPSVVWLCLGLPYTIVSWAGCDATAGASVNNARKRHDADV